MANSEQLAEASWCLNCCICCLKTVLLTSQWTLYCQWWLGSSVLSWDSDSLFPLCFTFQRTQWQQLVSSMEFLYQSHKRTQNGFSLWNLKLFSVVCVFSVQSSLPLHFSSALQFQQDYYCSLFYQVWQTCQCFIFRAVCPEILAYYPLEHKTDWTDVSDTLCDASPTDSVCRICERLNWDPLLLLDLPEKLVPLFQLSNSILFTLKAHMPTVQDVHAVLQNQFGRLSQK